MSITTPTKPVEEPVVDPLKELPVLPQEPNIPEEVVILRKARDYIAQPRKWVKRTYRKLTPTNKSRDYGATCAVGAIYHVTNSFINPYSRSARVGMNMSVYNALYALDLAAGGSMIDLNDEWTTSKQDVINVYNKAIEQLLKDANHA